jgi:outer membrane protein assembly factor BamB
MRFRVLLALLLLAPSAPAENWPQWRGPRLDGTSRDTGFPADCDPAKAAWRTPLPGEGHASPIVWHDRVFTVASIAESGERVLLCLDRATGKILWQTAVIKSPLEKKHGLNSHASSTPATDGERIFTAFLDVPAAVAAQNEPGKKQHVTPGEAVVSAHDFTGKPAWQKRVGHFSSTHGFCSSPVLYKDKVIVNCDHDGDGYIVALARADGRELWRVDRPNKTRSYCAPIIRELAGRMQMVLSGTKCVASYDPDDGKLIWIIDGPTEQFVASLVYNDRAGLLFMTGGFPEHHILAIRPDGAGNVTESHVAWHVVNKGVSYVPSPIAEGDYFLVVSDSGIGHCFEAGTGRIAWAERMGEHHASLVSAEGRVLFISDKGDARFVKPGEQYQMLAESPLQEKVFASPALSEGQIFVRGDKSLMCLGERKAASRTAAK